jgi:Chaperone of endosialidase
MKRLVLFSVGAVFGLFGSTLQAQVPQRINYQGRVVVGATNFNGTGLFKFALMNSANGQTLWSNDGTSNNGSEPTNAVSIAVSNGLYSVSLGDNSLPNMTKVPGTVFDNNKVSLRVWFNDGSHGSQLLSPDQRIASVGYAFLAAEVGNPVSGAIAFVADSPNEIFNIQAPGGLILSTQGTQGVYTPVTLNTDINSLGNSELSVVADFTSGNISTDGNITAGGSVTAGFINVGNGVSLNGNGNVQAGNIQAQSAQFSGNVQAQSFTTTSDRNTKEQFRPVNARAILARVASLPIETWNFKQDDCGVQHIGPMSQDFYAAFQVGPDDKHIATVDADGVAFAAIQGLNEIVQEQNAELAAKAKEIGALEKRLDQIEKTLKQAPSNQVK